MSELELLDVELPPYVYGVPYNSVVGGAVWLYGFAVEETSGTANARLVLYDGADSTSTTFFPIRLAPNESTSEFLGPGGIRFRIGLFPVVTAGAVAGMLFICNRADWAGGT